MAEDFLQIRITDVIVPSVQTNNAKIVDGYLSLSGDINTFGNSGNNLKLGLVDRNPIEDLDNLNYTTVLSEDLNGSSFLL